MKTDPADVDTNLKTTSGLTTYGRDERYIQNKLHLLGASSVVLHGVGDGMIPYCCLTKRIPCLILFGPRPGGEVHQKIIKKFLVEKVQALMEAAAPGSRWYRTITQLGCQAAEEKKPEKKTGQAAGAAPAPKKVPKAAAAAEAAAAANSGKKKRSSSSSSSSSEESSNTSKKLKKKE